MCKCGQVYSERPKGKQKIMRVGILERKITCKGRECLHAQSALMELIGSSQAICATLCDVHYKYIEGDGGIPQCHTQLCSLQEGLCVGNYFKNYAYYH